MSSLRRMQSSMTKYMYNINALFHIHDIFKNRSNLWFAITKWNLPFQIFFSLRFISIMKYFCAVDLWYLKEVSQNLRNWVIILYSDTAVHNYDVIWLCRKLDIDSAWTMSLCIPSSLVHDEASMDRFTLLLFFMCMRQSNFKSIIA